MNMRAMTTRFSAEQWFSTEMMTGYLRIIVEGIESVARSQRIPTRW
jgi:hypothetical protein